MSVCTNCSAQREFSCPGLGKYNRLYVTDLYKRVPETAPVNYKSNSANPSKTQHIVPIVAQMVHHLVMRHVIVHPDYCR